MKLFSAHIFRLLLPLFLLLAPSRGLAYEPVPVTNLSGQSVLQFNYYTKGENFREGEVNECGRGGKEPCGPFTRSLLAAERAALERAGAYWAQILSPGKAPAETVIYDIYPVAMYGNASAGPEILSMETDDGETLYYPAAGLVLAEGETPVKDGDLENHGNVYIGINPYNLQQNHILSPGPWSLEPVMIHELGHSLGITSINDDDAPNPTEPMTPFETYLRYDSAWDKTSDSLSPRWFFHGPLAMQVYGGPVPMEDEEHQQEKSHFGLRNTSMTHRLFRNYTAFVEVEMAALADSGYDIDLRNLFGRSVYTDNNVITNTQGFFARTADGSAYLPGRPNTSRYAMGLHIYGDNNTVYQAANLLADGPGAAGIRVDGAGTGLFINPGVRVTANGDRGTGLLVSYGSGSAVVHRGTIEATGLEGDAVRFDIGANLIDSNFDQNPDSYGNMAQYSYLDINNMLPHLAADSTIRDEFERAEALLNGPLVERFDVTGSIIGSRNAVIIGGNSHVGEINLMRGAVVRGRIVNDYYYYSNGRATELTFGRAADADGQVVSGQLDPDFRYVIGHDILGWGAPVADGPGSGRGLFNLGFRAGQSTLMPWATIKVNSFTLDRGASLMAVADITNPNRIWSNDVNLAAGSRLGVSDGFHFGPKLEKNVNYPVLSFNLIEGASGTLVNRNEFAGPGKLSVGIYDYASADLRWSDVTPTSMTMALSPTGPGRRNRVRAGDQATAAPMQMLLSDQGWRKVLNRPAQAWRHDRDAEDVSRRTQALRPDRNTDETPGHDRGKDGEETRLHEEGKNADAVWRKRMWGGPYYSYSNYDGSGGLDDVSVNTPGVVVGYEGVSDSFLAGLALTANWPKADGDGYENRGESVSLAAYFGAKLPLEVELGAAVSYGYMTFDQERSSDGTKYSSDYDGRFFKAGLSLGRRFSLYDDLSLRPSAIGEYLHLSLDDYSEKGGGLQAQTRDSTSKSLWQSDLGIELAWNPPCGLALSGRVGWAHIYGDRRTDLRAHFTADPHNRFTSFGDALNRDSLTLDLAAAFSVNEALSFKLDYQHVSGPHSTSHAGEVMAVFAF